MIAENISNKYQKKRVPILETLLFKNKNLL